MMAGLQCDSYQLLNHPIHAKVKTKLQTCTGVGKLSKNMTICPSTVGYHRILMETRNCASVATVFLLFQWQKDQIVRCFQQKVKCLWFSDFLDDAWNEQQGKKEDKIVKQLTWNRLSCRMLLAADWIYFKYKYNDLHSESFSKEQHIDSVYSGIE